MLIILIRLINHIHYTYHYLAIGARAGWSDGEAPPHWRDLRGRAGAGGAFAPGLPARAPIARPAASGRYS